MDNPRDDTNSAAHPDQPVGTPVEAQPSDAPNVQNHAADRPVAPAAIEAEDQANTSGSIDGSDVKPTSRMENFVSGAMKHAEVYALFIFLALFAMWLYFLPRKKPPTPEDDLKHKLEIALKVSPPEKSEAEVNELKRDLTAWERYEDELSIFQWGSDLNWYLYSGLRVLVIILSAVTPALIVAPMLKDKKFLAALPAAIVAIGTGCISEFDFKTEAARYETALVQRVGEKSAFITQSSRFYKIYPPTSQASVRSTPGSTSAAQGADVSQSVADDVPFPIPSSYPETRANFSFRIEKILQDQTGERIRFLRGEKEPAAKVQPPTKK
jgi:hypothetical protein